MQNQSYIRAVSPPKPAGKPSATEQLDNARRRVQLALNTASREQPSYHTLDEVARTLTKALRDLDGLRVAVAVLSRKEVKQVNG